MNTISPSDAHRVLRHRARARSRDQAGQATAEYALLTGAVALVLGLVAAWAAGTGRISALFDAVFDGLIRAAG